MQDLQFSLCCLAYCHVYDAKTIIQLRSMLKSWQDSTDAIPMIISLSWCDNISRLMPVVLLQLKTDYPGLIITVVDDHEKPHTSLLWHYNVILGIIDKAIKEEKSTKRPTEWFIFTNERDIWHPRRVSYILKAINHVMQLRAANKMIDYIYNPVTIEISHNSDGLPKDAVEVDKLVTAGMLHPRNIYNEAGEMYQYCLSRIALTTMLRDMTDFLNDNYTELLAIKYMRVGSNQNILRLDWFLNKEKKDPNSHGFPLVSGTVVDWMNCHQQLDMSRIEINIPDRFKEDPKIMAFKEKIRSIGENPEPKLVQLWRSCYVYCCSGTDVDHKTIKKVFSGGCPENIREISIQTANYIIGQPEMFRVLKSPLYK